MAVIERHHPSEGAMVPQTITQQPFDAYVAAAVGVIEIEMSVKSHHPQIALFVGCGGEYAVGVERLVGSLAIMACGKAVTVEVAQTIPRAKPHEVVGGLAEIRDDVG